MSFFGGKMKSDKILIIVLILNLDLFCKIGQSAIISLTFPFGARQNAMGEIGTALADDETCTFWNPAGLGVKNENWRTGKFSFFYEKLLASFKIPDIWHSTIAICFQPKSYDKLGGFGFYMNFLSLGSNNKYNIDGSIGETYSSYERVFSISWGIPITNIIYFGFATKYFVSSILHGTDYYGDGDGVVRSFALDLALLCRFIYGINFGLTLTNIGPAVSYLSKTDKAPIPFTVTLALAYQREFIYNNLRMSKLSLEYNIGREMINNEPGKKPDPFIKAIVTSWQNQSFRESWQEIIHNWGSELTIFNFFSFRMGILIDKVGVRKELHLGLGISVLNHFSLDWYRINSQTRSIARHGQFGISLGFTNLFKWSDKDFRWWESE